MWIDNAGSPTRVGVKTGVMGHHESMASLGDTRVQNGQLMAYDKPTVKVHHRADDTDQPLDAEQTAQLYAHYRVRQQPRGSGEVMRSEERLRVGTPHRPAGHGSTAHVCGDRGRAHTVPVGHDEPLCRASRSPPRTRGNARADIGDSEQEMDLRAERPCRGQGTGVRRACPAG